MSLPGLELNQWLMSLSNDERKSKLPYSMDKVNPHESISSDRVPTGIVAAYYKDYVFRQGLDKNFRS